MAITIDENGYTITGTWADGAKTPAGDTSPLTQRDIALILYGARSVEGLVLERFRSVIAKSRKTILQQSSRQYFADPNVNTDDEVIDAVMADADYKDCDARFLAALQGA